ncbi:hypothetical protein NDU88_004430 [Pleurodeles waltl]|uniref:Uncharacterized protein n=1 Tax=Pleurodeles waltl TaxID=8319 RepID=A0AAV7SIU8_PLEWA|nr:hypothetical protein NDU88_004430 [Pleurodeles waltl]
MPTGETGTATPAGAQSHADKRRQPAFAESAAYSLCRVAVRSLLDREKMHRVPASTLCGRMPDPQLAPGLACRVFSKRLSAAAVTAAVSVLGGVR